MLLFLFIIYSSFGFTEPTVNEGKLAGVKEVRGSYRPLKRAKKLKPIAQVYGRFHFAELSALTSNGAKRSDNFCNFLTPKGILNP